jgi:hypothetical protein
MLCFRAGPADGPSHLITAKMLAPRVMIRGGVAVDYGEAERESAARH